MKPLVLTMTFFALGSFAKCDDDVERFLQNYPLLTRGQFSVADESVPNQFSKDTQRTEINVHVDIPRWKMASKTTDFEFKDGRNQTRISHFERLWSENFKYSISADPKNTIINGIAAHVKKLDDREYRRAFQSVASFATHGRTQWNDMRTFFEVIREDKTSIVKSTDTIQGKKLIVIKISNPWGTHQFWVDPAKNHVLIKMIQEKTGNDLVTEGKMLSQIKRGQSDAGERGIVSIRDEYVTQKTSLLDSKHYVSQFQRFCTTKYDDGLEFTVSNIFTLNNVKKVDAWPQDPFIFTAKIPDGTPVTAQDDKPIEYEWRKGAVVKKVNTGELDALGSSDFVKPQSSGLTRIVLLVAFLSAITGLIVWLALRRAKGKPR